MFPQHCPKLNLYRIVPFGLMLILRSDVVLSLFSAPPHLHVHYIFEGCVVTFY